MQEWLCKGMSVDWEAWSVFVAASVFLWDQHAKRRDRRAGGRLMARLLVPELRHLKVGLEAIQAQMPGAGHFGPGGPSSAVRDLLAADLVALSTPSVDRALSDLTVLPSNVSDKMTSMLGWLSQVRTTPYLDANIPYGLGNWPATYAQARGLMEQTIQACEGAVEAAQAVGGPHR